VEAIHQFTGQTTAQTDAEPHDQVCRTVFAGEQMSHTPGGERGEHEPGPELGCAYHGSDAKRRECAQRFFFKLSAINAIWILPPS